MKQEVIKSQKYLSESVTILYVSDTCIEKYLWL
jgi:hypothetical protein